MENGSHYYIVCLLQVFHYFTLQLIVQGRRDKTITVIKVDKFKDNKTIPDIKLNNLEALDCVNNIEFEQLINSTIEAVFILEEGRVIDCNTEGIKLFGYEVTNAKGP